MNNLEVDTKALAETFRELSFKNQKKATKETLGAAASILTTRTRDNMIASNANLGHSSKKYKDTILDAVRIHYDDSGLGVKVHIMGTRDKASGTFRARFFEKGTKERILKRKKKDGSEWNVGSVQPLNFFKDAQAQTESQIFSALDRLLAESIERITAK